MTITSHGPKCDICGKYILLEPVDEFTMAAIEQKMHCHQECGEILLNCGQDWTKLPNGPLRKVFEKHNTRKAIL
jgi:hypothetical protein